MPTGGFVLLDTALIDELVAEGYARDTIRVVQDARKEAGLNISDRISLTLLVPQEHQAQVDQFKDLICSETLAISLEVQPAAAGASVSAQVAKA